MALATRGILGAKALDPTTVQITCSRPKADMERIFIPILPEHVWSKVTPKAAETSFTNPVPIVGSGPFFTSEFVKGKFLRMERNPYYYGTTPTVDEIIFATYQNPDTMTIDYKSGNLDAAWGIPVAQFRTLGSEPGTEALAYPYYNWEYLNFNCYDSPDSLGAPVLKDWKFRNAINYAIDRAKLCAIAFQGYAAPGTTIVPPKTWKDPDYHWQPAAERGDGLRPGQGRPGCWMQPATRSRAGSAWTSRASRSRCASTRPPTTCRPRPRASSSPAGSSSWGSRSSSRCWTRAPSAPACGTSRATRTGPTSTCTSTAGWATSTRARR